MTIGGEILIMKISKQASIAALCLASIATSSGAFAAGSSAQSSSQVTCKSSSYECQNWGYAGIDTYGYSGYSHTATNGTKHNCTAYAAYMLDLITPHDDRWRYLGDASAWATNARAKGLQVGTTPHTRDVAQWNSGHVAFVEQVNMDSNGKVVSIVVTDDNLNTLVTTAKVILAGSTTVGLTFPDNFITFPKFVAGGGGKPPYITTNPLVTRDLESDASQ